MATLSEKFDYLSKTKNLIKEAIAEKGVPVDDQTPFRSYPAKIKQIGTQATVTGWTPHWYDTEENLIDISNPGKNTIKLLIDINLSQPYLSFWINSTGSYSIDWGDNVVEVYSGESIVAHVYEKDETDVYRVIEVQAMGNADLTGFKTMIFNVSSALSDHLPILWLTLNAPIVNLSFVSNATNNQIVCPFLESIELESVLSLDTYAFSASYALVNVKLPESLETVGTFAFDKCYSLKFAKLPEGITSIPNNLFNQGYNVEKVNIPEGVESIGAYAFNYACKCKEIIIPEGVLTF